MRPARVGREVVQAERADEDCQPAIQPLRVGWQLVDAPCDRRLDPDELASQPVHDEMRRQGPEHRRDQLDREREAVETLHEAGDRGRACVGDRHLGTGGRGTVEQELDGRAGGDLGCAGVRARNGQRRDRHGTETGPLDRDPARHQQTQPRAGFGHEIEQPQVVEDDLDGIQDEERGRGPDGLREGVGHLVEPGATEAEGRRDLRLDPGVPAGRGQVDPGDAAARRHRRTAARPRSRSASCRRPPGRSGRHGPPRPRRRS